MGGHYFAVKKGAILHCAETKALYRVVKTSRSTSTGFQRVWMVDLNAEPLPGKRGNLESHYEPGVWFIKTDQLTSDRFTEVRGEKDGTE